MHGKGVHFPESSLGLAAYQANLVILNSLFPQCSVFPPEPELEAALLCVLCRSFRAFLSLDPTITRDAISRWVEEPSKSRHPTSAGSTIAFQPARSPVSLLLSLKGSIPSSCRTVSFAMMTDRPGDVVWPKGGRCDDLGEPELPVQIGSHVPLASRGKEGPLLCAVAFGSLLDKLDPLVRC